MHRSNSDDSAIRTKALKDFEKCELFIKSDLFLHLYKSIHGSEEHGQEDLLTSKQTNIENAKGNNLRQLAEEINALTILINQWFNLATKIDALELDDVKDPKILIVAPFVEAVYETGIRLMLDQLTNPKPTQQTNAEISLLSDTFKYSRRILADPENKKSLEDLMNHSLRLERTTKNQEKWRMLKSRVATIISGALAMATFAIPPLLEKAQQWYEYSREVRLGTVNETHIEKLSKSVGMLKNEILEMPTNTNTDKAEIEQKNIPPFDKNVKKLSTDISSLSLQLGEIKSTLGLQKVAFSAKPELITNLFKRIKANPPTQIEEKLKIHPLIETIYKKSQELAKILNSNVQIDILDTIIKHVSDMLKNPTSCKDSIEGLVKTFQEIPELPNEKKWRPLVAELQKLIKATNAMQPKEAPQKRI